MPPFFRSRPYCWALRLCRGALEVPTINDTPKLLRDLDFAIAQLRHAYTHLMAGRATNQEEFGRGLIAPEIRRLERVRRELVE